MQHRNILRAAPVALVLVLASALAGFASADPPVHPVEPPECAKPAEDHHFCCETVVSEGKGSGDGCVKISEDSVNSCSEVLGCTHGYTKSGGTVRCTGPE